MPEARLRIGPLVKLGWWRFGADTQIIVGVCLPCKPQMMRKSANYCYLLFS
jgi:hypothetical protein